MTDSAPRPLRLLVWDAPNIDVGLGSLLGARRPLPAERPRWDALARFLVGRADPDEDVEACVFINVQPGSAANIREWVEIMRNLGSRSSPSRARPRATSTRISWPTCAGGSTSGG